MVFVKQANNGPTVWQTRPIGNFSGRGVHIILIHDDYNDEPEDFAFGR